MKTQLGWGILLTLLSMAVTPSITQAQSTTYVETSKIIGTEVKTAQGDQVGQIKDVVLDSNTGCIAYTVVATGGTAKRITGTAKTVVVPWTVYSGVSPEEHVYTVRVDKEKIYSAPVFEYSRIREYGNPQWVSQVYSHYGVSESTGVSGGGNYNYQRSTTGGMETTTTGAGASSGAAATASPGTTMTPSATVSPGTTVSPAATASPSASQSPAESASPSPSRSPRSRHGAAEEGSPRGRTRASATPAASHHHTEMSPGEQGKESAAEETGTSSGQGKGSSHRHRTEDSPRPESSGTPEQQ